MKLNRFFTVVFTVLVCNLALGQASNKIVLKVGNESVTLSDFEHIYKKNNNNVAVTKEGLDEYMDLFVKFKLKVVEAEALGMDTAADFTKELSGYRKQLARPYLVDTELLDEIIHEAYARQQIEVKARHILVTVGENAAAADTIRAWNRIHKLKDRIKSGEDFETVAKSKNGSDDPSVTQNGGDLGWFTAFKMVYPFEEAAYNTPLGEISDIVRTRFGYHFLEVTDKREAKGEIKVAHIMIRVSDTQNKNLIDQGKTEIDAINAFLKNGESFESLALKYSDDESSKSKGGVLQWFSSGKMVEEFENASFSLENNGDVSEPFMTSYGWHIVKRLDYKEPASFEEVEKSLRKKVSRDKRAEVTKTSFIKKLKNEYTYRIFPGRVTNLKNAAGQIDSLFHKGHPLVHNRSHELNKTLFSIAGYNTTVGDFIEYANTVKKKDINLSSNLIIDELIKRISDEKLLAHENSRLEEKHDDFRLLINEYHDGILLFELTDEMVWSKAVKDTLGLVEYHTSNKDLFMWDERADISAYICENNDVAKKVEKTIFDGGSVLDLRKSMLADSPLAIKIEEGLFPRETNTWGDHVFRQRESNSLNVKKGAPNVIKHAIEGDAYVVIDVRGFVPPTHKSLEEARGQVIASYQDHLEKRWVEDLRSKYTVEINEEVLYELID
ncbi:MAG: hypothetical protein CL850_01225 [Crocinitomicaceae bacterium]|nr:hypothetical protein [Crocinitomicaceae bacterium]|tara:strand:- start:1514 stop:3514 length:2001 start_codon:yes stop_codon:yes gene_type:complete